MCSRTRAEQRTSSGVRITKRHVATKSACRRLDWRRSEGTASVIRRDHAGEARPGRPLRLVAALQFTLPPAQMLQVGFFDLAINDGLLRPVVEHLINRVNRVLRLSHDAGHYARAGISSEIGNSDLEYLQKSM